MSAAAPRARWRRPGLAGLVLVLVAALAGAEEGAPGNDQASASQTVTDEAIDDAAAADAEPASADPDATNSDEDPPTPLPEITRETPSELALLPALPGARAFRLRFDSEFIPAADLEDGGDVSTYRPGARLQAAIPVTDRLVLQGIGRYAATFYDFDGTQDFYDFNNPVKPGVSPPSPSSSPVDDLHELVWSLQAGYHLNPTGHLLVDGERWSLLGELFVASRFEQGAFGNGFLGGGGIAVGYEIPRRLQVVVGATLRTRVADATPSFDPVVSLRWRVTPELTLRTRGRGGQIEYRVRPGLKFHAAGFFTGQSWRLDRRRGVPTRTVLNDRQVRAALGVEWHLHRQLRLHLEIGSVAKREIEVDVRSGRKLSSIDADPSAFLVLSLELRP